MIKRKQTVEVTLEDGRRVWLTPDAIAVVRDSRLSQKGRGLLAEVCLTTGESFPVREQGDLVVSRIAAAKGELQ